METLQNFVTRVQAQPAPNPQVVGGAIVDGAGLPEWTPEQLTAEAYSQGVLDPETTEWANGLALVMAVALTKHDGPGPHDSGSPQSVHGRPA
jgi:hypothetical protein